MDQAEEFVAVSEQASGCAGNRSLLESSGQLLTFLVPFSG
jgi:hypothetical protein